MVRRIVNGCIVNGTVVRLVGITFTGTCGCNIAGGHTARRRAAEDRVQRGLGAQDGAADGLGELRHNGVAEGLDDQTRRRRPFAAAERNARPSQPGGNPIIHA